MKLRPRTTLGLVLIMSAALAVAGWDQARRRRALAGTKATDALRNMGALVILDASRKHALTVDLRLPAVREHTAKAMALLPKLPRLENLQLGGLDVTDQQLKHIAANRSLKAIGLNQTAIGDAGLEQLTGLHNLLALYLAGTNVTSASQRSIEQLSRLEILDLSHTKIGADATSLPNLENLQHLLLSGVDLSDEAMASLARLPRLTRLTLVGSNVSEQATEQLTAARPEIQIDR